MDAQIKIMADISRGGNVTDGARLSRVGVPGGRAYARPYQSRDGVGYPSLFVPIAPFFLPPSLSSILEKKVFAKTEIED